MDIPVLALIASFIGMAFVVTSYLVRKKSLYLACQSLCLVFLIIAYFFEVNFFGMIGLGIGLVRAFTFFVYEQKDKDAPIFWSFAFTLLTTINFYVNMFVLKTGQALDVLCLMALIAYAFIFRIRSLKIVRFTMLFPTVLSILYNLLVGAALFTTLTYVFELIVNCVSIVRYHILPYYAEKYGWTQGGAGMKNQTTYEQDNKENVNEND